MHRDVELVQGFEDESLDSLFFRTMPHSTPTGYHITSMQAVKENHCWMIIVSIAPNVSKETEQVIYALNEILEKMESENID